MGYQTLAFTALKGELWPTAFEWRSAQEGTLHLSLRSGSSKGLEKILVRLGRVVEVDPVLIGFWDDRRPTQVLDEVGRIMGESVPQGRPMRSIEPGWSTWHSYQRDITAETVLKAAWCMKEELYDAGYRYIQIEGGCRVPFIASWPEQIKPRVSDQFFMVWNEQRNSLKAWGDAPTRIEPVAGKIHLAGIENAESIIAVPLNGAGVATETTINAVRDGERWTLTLSAPALSYRIDITR